MSLIAQFTGVSEPCNLIADLIGSGPIDILDITEVESWLVIEVVRYGTLRGPFGEDIPARIPISYSSGRWCLA